MEPRRSAGIRATGPLTPPYRIWAPQKNRATRYRVQRGFVCVEERWTSCQRCTLYAGVRNISGARAGRPNRILLHGPGPAGLHAHETSRSSASRGTRRYSRPGRV